MLENLPLSSSKCDLILKCCLKRIGENISSNSILVILRESEFNLDIKKDEIEVFIKYLHDNNFNFVETIVKPNKIQIKANSLTETFINNGGFSKIEDLKKEANIKENNINDIDTKQKIWSYNNRYLSIIISLIALIISIITIGFKIYETMYPKESEQIKSMKKEILQLKAQDSLFLLEKSLKK